MPSQGVARRRFAMDKLTSKTITDLRLPLAIMVVFIHTAWGLDNCIVNWVHLSGVDFYNITRIACSSIISPIAVPTFFLISGFLFFAKATTVDWNFYKKQWSKRIHTLLIPYLIWNIGFAVVLTCREVFAVFVKGQPVSTLYEYLSSVCTLNILWNWCSWGGGDHNVFGQIVNVTTGPILGSLWNISDLMVVIILTPLLYWLIRKTKGLIVAAFGVMWLFSVNIMIQKGIITALCFFSIGSSFAIYQREFAGVCLKWAKISVPIWLALICASVYMFGTNASAMSVIVHTQVVIGMFAFVGIIAHRAQAEKETSHSRMARIVEYAADNTFFIYAAHNAFGLQTTRKILALVFSIFPVNPIFMTIHYLLTPFLAIAICLIALYVLSRLFPRFTNVMIGQRSANHIPATK